MYINSNYNDVSFRSRLWITEAVGILLATGEGPRWAPTSKITRCVSTIVHGWIPIWFVNLHLLIIQSPVLCIVCCWQLYFWLNPQFSWWTIPKKNVIWCDMFPHSNMYIIYIYYIIFVIWWYMCWLWSLFSWWKPHGPGQLHPPQRPSQPSTCGA